MKIKTLIILILGLATSAWGQDTYYSIFSYNYLIPKVRINDRSVSLQQSVLPQMYKERSATRDMRWVAENDSTLATFWEEKGDTVLHVLREYSGVEWYEPEFDIYLVRYYPSIGAAEPLILPIGGIQRGSALEAAPDGDRLILNLVFQLAKRMLAQASQPEDDYALSLSFHPLMSPGQFRRDNLAMLLAVLTCQYMLGVDATDDAYRSAFWKKEFAGREIFEKYLFDSWTLSPDRKLADWIAEEPRSSSLVNITRPPRRTRPGATAGPRHHIESLPLKGILGFSVKIGDGNRLVVDKIDVYRLAYACGMRADDVIRRVDGRIVRNQKQLVETTLEGIENGGATVEILRDGQTWEVVLQPIATNFYMDDVYEEEYFELPDSLSTDTLHESPDEL